MPMLSTNIHFAVVARSLMASCSEMNTITNHIIALKNFFLGHSNLFK